MAPITRDGANVRGAAGTIWLFSALACLGVAVLYFSTGTSNPRLALGALCLVTLASGNALFWNLRHANQWTGITSTMAGALGVVAYVIPGTQLLNAERVSRLTELQASVLTSQDDFAQNFGTVTLAIGALSLCENIASRFVATPEKPYRLVSQFGLMGGLASRRVFLGAVAIGVTATLLGPTRSASDLVDRGQVQGAGALTAVALALPVALSIGIIYRHWDSKFLALASLAGFLILVTLAQSRSPILILAIALAIRIIRGMSDGAGNRTSGGRAPVGRAPVGRVVALVCVAYVVIVFIVAFSAYRSDLMNYTAKPAADYVIGAAMNPVGELATVGALDTFDGLTLARHVSPETMNASFTDPLKGITNIIPRQIWVDKPEFISARVTRTYTTFGGLSGIFLSGPGYLYLVWGGLPGVVLGFALIGVFGAAVSRSHVSDVARLFFLYFLTRFIVAGEAFDIAYVMSMIVGVQIARAMMCVMPRRGNKSWIAEREIAPIASSN